MRLPNSAALAAAVGAVAAGLLLFAAPGLPDAADAATDQIALQPVSAFGKIRDKEARSVALFEEAGKVIRSPRCLNCHPATDRPTQTDRMVPHQPLVVRGEGGMGAPGGLACTTCHHQANFDPAGVPGSPKWALAPAEMAWQGKTLGQICVQIKDKERNGSRDMAELIKHMSEDDLVGWAWHPGKGRTPAPGSQKRFGELIRAWAETGASCPSG